MTANPRKLMIDSPTKQAPRSAGLRQHFARERGDIDQRAHGAPAQANRRRQTLASEKSAAPAKPAQITLDSAQRATGSMTMSNSHGSPPAAEKRATKPAITADQRSLF